MASHVVVIATDLRRTTVKVTPGTYLTDVLQQACKKLNLSSDKYLLKHKQKQLDLSIPFRQAGLSPGAKLELVIKSNTPSAVSVALQLPQPDAFTIPGGRLVDKFPSDFTLWKVLRQFESGAASAGRNVNITARGVAQTATGGQTGSGQLYYETPVLNIMGRELAKFEDFQKTLSQLGYNSGSVLIRLSYKTTDITLFAAMGEISKFFFDAEVEQKNKDSAPAPLVDVGEQPLQAPPVSESVDADVQAELSSSSGGTKTQEAAINTPSGVEESAGPSNDSMDVDPAEPTDPMRPVSIFKAPTSTTPVAALAAVSDSDFTPTIAHAKLHQARLQASSLNKRLPSDKELEAQAAAETAKIAAVTTVSVRVRFPDTTSAQWNFGPDATGATLYKAVRSVMADDTQAFRLALPGGKGIINDSDSPSSSLVKGYKITGGVLVSLVWDGALPPDVRNLPFLKGSLAKQATEISVPELPQVEDSKDDEQSVVPPPTEQKSSGEGSLAKKIPKWLKLPGKK